jgi:hypothetical protein
MPLAKLFLNFYSQPQAARIAYGNPPRFGHDRGFNVFHCLQHCSTCKISPDHQNESIRFIPRDHSAMKATDMSRKRRTMCDFACIETLCRQPYQVPARHRLRENVCPNQGHRGVGTGRSSTDLSKNCSLSIRRTISQNTSSLEDRNNYNTLTSDSEGSNTKLRNSWHDNPEV